VERDRHPRPDLEAGDEMSRLRISFPRMTPGEKAESRRLFNKSVADARAKLDRLDRIREQWPLLVQAHPWIAPLIFIQWLIILPYSKGLRALLSFLERTFPG
jgi:hypothetical protein